MPAIKLSDTLGAEVDVALADRSALLSYLRQIGSVVIEQTGLSNLGGLTLDQPAVRDLRIGLLFHPSIGGGDGSSELRIGAGAHGSFTVVRRKPGAEHLFAPDSLGAAVEIPEEACFVKTGVEASVGLPVPGPAAGMTQFGAEPNTAIEIANYRRYSLDSRDALLDALRDGFRSFVVPVSVSDLASMPVNAVATAKVTGSLKLSATAELFAVTNPLAAATLPGPLPSVSVRAGGSLQVGASYEIRGRYEVRVHKRDGGHLEIGWYRERGSEFRVRATAAAGVSAQLGDRDILPLLLRAISPDPAAERDELLRAGLAESQIKGIQSAVKSAVNRNLELAVSTEIGRARSTEAAFLYDVDFSQTTAESLQSIDQALRGDLTALHAEALPGVVCRRSVWTEVRSTRITWNVNLLGIFNFISIAKLIQQSSVLYEPASGALVITDRVTFEKIQSAQVNFGADTEKLRHILAESFLITAAYRGSQTTVGGPALRCSHSFFESRNNASREDILRHMRAASALQLLSGAEMELPAELTDFGRTTLCLQTEYDESLTAALFLDSAGKPYARQTYEAVGRATITMLVARADSDEARLDPATDDNLWREMKRLGQMNFKPLFPGVPDPVVGAIIADYTTIIWWSEAMAGAAKRLAAIRQLLQVNPGMSPDDPAFQKARKKLASHLKKVAARTTAEFGQPWGLLAMYTVSQRGAAASLLIASAEFSRRKEKALGS
jgi:hypothetical protein